jgi:hypothetical protein
LKADLAGPELDALELGLTNALAREVVDHGLSHATDRSELGDRDTRPLLITA